MYPDLVVPSNLVLPHSQCVDVQPSPFKATVRGMSLVRTVRSEDMHRSSIYMMEGHLRLIPIQGAINGRLTNSCCSTLYP